MQFFINLVHGDGISISAYIDVDHPNPPLSAFSKKVAFFQKDQLGIGVWQGKPGEMGQNWILEPFFSEI